jgi:colicin import membrane protein
MPARNATVLSGLLHLAAIGLILLFASKPPSGTQLPVRYRPVRLVALPGKPGVTQAAPEVKPKERATTKAKAKEKVKPKPKAKQKVTTSPSSKARATAEAKPETKSTTPGTGEGGQGGVRLDGASFPYPYYLSNIQIKILSNFKPVIRAREAKGLKAVVFFIINRSGRISDVKLEQKSGHFLFDQEAQRAVLRSNPLPALPPAFGSDRLGVHFEFVASD